MSIQIEMVVDKFFKLSLTCINALNQQVLPTFFNPTGHQSSRLRKYGFKGSTNHKSFRFRLVPGLVSAKLASRTLQRKIVQVVFLYKYYKFIIINVLF